MFVLPPLIEIVRQFQAGCMGEGENKAYVRVGGCRNLYR